MINRRKHLLKIRSLMGQFQVTAILGARQVGKTTLARQVLAQRPGRVNWFDLESPDEAARLAEPMMTLGKLTGTTVLDEIQRLPEVFQVLRVLSDRKPLRQRFLVLGSASPSLLKQTSESLAGRISYHTLGGFSLDEAGLNRSPRLWLRGGFPRSFLAGSDEKSWTWRSEFVRTFLEREVSELGVGMPAQTLRRFWTMLSHYHGQVWNASEFGRSFGVSDQAVRRYLDLLASTFMVRLLLPWHENIGKRQVKAPKVYLSDTGMLHALMGIRDAETLASHPKVGASWEGFALEETIRRLGAEPEECFFWATHAGAELDLLVVRGQRRRGFEFKLTHAPSVTPSMRHALKDLRLEDLTVVHAGKDDFPMGERIRAVALDNLLTSMKPL